MSLAAYGPLLPAAFPSQAETPELLYFVLVNSLFSLMLSCGIPELREAEDIRWLEEKLMLGKSDAEASEHLRGEIQKALRTKMTQANDLAHVLKHY